MERNLSILQRHRGCSQPAFTHLRGRAFLQRRPARRHPILHHFARRYRTREIEQAERRSSSEVPELRLYGYGPSGIQARDGEAWGESYAACHGDVDGRDAHLDVGIYAV